MTHTSEYVITHKTKTNVHATCSVIMTDLSNEKHSLIVQLIGHKFSSHIFLSLKTSRLVSFHEAIMLRTRFDLHSIFPICTNTFWMVHNMPQFKSIIARWLSKQHCVTQYDIVLMLVPSQKPSANLRSRFSNLYTVAYWDQTSDTTTFLTSGRQEGRTPQFREVHTPMLFKCGGFQWSIYFALCCSNEDGTFKTQIKPHTCNGFWYFEESKQYIIFPTKVSSYLLLQHNQGAVELRFNTSEQLMETSGWIDYLYWRVH